MDSVVTERTFVDVSSSALSAVLVALSSALSAVLVALSSALSAVLVALSSALSAVLVILSSALSGEGKTPIIQAVVGRRRCFAARRFWVEGSGAWSRAAAETHSPQACTPPRTHGPVRSSCVRVLLGGVGRIGWFTSSVPLVEGWWPTVFVERGSHSGHRYGDATDRGHGNRPEQHLGKEPRGEESQHHGPAVRHAV